MTSIAEKISRDEANMPSVTSAVRSSRSTPTRHDAPICTCAAVVAATPARATTRPATRTGPWSRTATGARPTSPATGAASPAATATTNPSFAHHCTVPGAAWRRRPVSPVRRHCSQVRQPKATPAKPT